MAVRKVKHLDASSLRALAHPLRVRIVGRLRIDGPATATMLANDLGESSGATSYHLRALAKAGFVEEEVGRGTGRERWWRAAQDMTSWQTGDFRGDPDAEAAEEWLLGHQARQAMDRIDAWLDQRTKADPGWVAVADSSDYFMRMTPEQVKAMLDEVHAVVQRHIAAADDAPTPPDALLARLYLFAVPDADAIAGAPPGAEGPPGEEGPS